MTATASPFRVKCSEHVVPASSYGTAFRRQLSIASTGACAAEHAIEGRTAEGEWVPAHLALAEGILAAKVGTRVESFDGSLTKQSGSWTREQERQASSVAAEGTPEWVAAIRQYPHESAVLTSDGSGAIVDAWCGCGTDAARWVQYERWSARGREAHGFVCPQCRRLTQTG